MRILSLIVALGLILLAMLAGATLWATEKSKERTECYKKADEECAPRGRLENLLHDLLM